MGTLEGWLPDRVRAGEEAVAADGTPRWTNRIHRDDLVAALLLAATHPTPPPALMPWLTQ